MGTVCNCKNTETVADEEQTEAIMHPVRMVAVTDKQTTIGVQETANPSAKHSQQAVEDSQLDQKFTTKMLNEESKESLEHECEQTARTNLQSPKARRTDRINESDSQDESNGLNMQPVAWPFTSDEEEKINKSPSMVVKKRYSRKQSPESSPEKSRAPQHNRMSSDASLVSLTKLDSLRSSVLNHDAITEEPKVQESSFVSTPRVDIKSNDPPIVAFPVPQSKRLLWYNLTKNPAEMTVLRKLPYLFSGMEDDCNFVPWLFLDEDTLFICGGIRRGQYMPNTYEYMLSSTELVQKANMNKSRICHGLYKVNDQIYAFTGQRDYKPTPNNEVYSRTTDRWTQLPDIPCEGIIQATVARISENLFVTGLESANIYKFSIANKEFSTLQFTLPQPEENHKLFSSDNFLYVIEHEKVYMLSEDGEEQDEFDNTSAAPIQWLPGPPVYLEGKVYFAASNLGEDHLYSFDLENPDKGVLLEKEKCCTTALLTIGLIKYL